MTALRQCVYWRRGGCVIGAFYCYPLFSGAGGRTMLYEGARLARRKLSTSLSIACACITNSIVIVYLSKPHNCLQHIETTHSTITPPRLFRLARADSQRRQIEGAEVRWYKNRKSIPLSYQRITAWNQNLLTYHHYENIYHHRPVLHHQPRAV